MSATKDNGYRNTSYIFIPIFYKESDDFKSGDFESSDFKKLTADINANPDWIPVNDNIKYMLKYVADKFTCTNGEDCLCRHYMLRSESCQNYGIRLSDFDYYIESKFTEVSKYPFCINDIQLFCFNTCVCILVFRITLKVSDPLWIGSAQFELKKVSKKLKLANDSGYNKSILDITETILNDLSQNSELTCFDYAIKGQERANLFSYVEVEKKDDYHKDLYYMRHCYGSGYLYNENPECDRREIYSSSLDIMWGITSEAVACLACPDMGRRDFIRNTFYNNFKNQYLFMYVLLLHQKYFLYMMMTRIGVGAYNSLENLEDYQNELYEFETNFVYNCVTEVPQYQELYERIAKEFSIKKMFKDVREPLIRLGELRKKEEELRKEEEEKKVQKRDQTLNYTLALIAVLAIFSALIDSFNFVASLPSMSSENTFIIILQLACIAIIVVVVAFAFKTFFKNREKDTDKNEEKD